MRIAGCLASMATCSPLSQDRQNTESFSEEEKSGRQRVQVIDRTDGTNI